jgi:hypothetical protein
MKASTKSKSLFLLLRYCAIIVISSSISSCECNSPYRKPTSPLETFGNTDTKATDNTSQLTMETDKHMLLGNDKELTLIFRTIDNRRPAWNNYRLKISLEEPIGEENNKIDFRNGIGLQNSLDKHLSDFTNLDETYTNNSWQLAFSLQPSATCNELTIKIELLTDGNTTPIEIKKASWKNIQLSLKDICFDPITGIITWSIENTAKATVDEVRFKHSIIGKSTATIKNISNIDSLLIFQPLSQKKLELKLNFNKSESVEIVFELWYKENKIASHLVILKDIQISIEGIAENQSLDDNQPVTAWIKNKGSYTINTKELIIDITHPSHIILILSDALGNYTKLTPCKFILSDIVGEKEMAYGDSVPLILKFSKAFDHTQAIANLAIRATQITYIQLLASKTLNWAPPRQEPCPNGSRQGKPDTTTNFSKETPSCHTNSSNTDFTPHQPENIIPNNNTSVPENTPPSPPTTGSSQQPSPESTTEDTFNSAYSTKTTASDSTTHHPISSNTGESGGIKFYGSSKTYGSVEAENKNPASTTDEQFNIHVPLLKNISQLAEELPLAFLDNKDELTCLIELLWKFIEELDITIPQLIVNDYKEATKVYIEIAKTYKRAIKAYASISVQLMDTQLTDLLPSLSEKVELILIQASSIASLAKTKAAYTATSKAYSYAAMSHMAHCKNRKAGSHAQRAFELATHANSIVSKNASPKAYTYVATAYCYAALANNYLFYTIQQEDTDKLIDTAAQASKAANKASFAANLCKTNTAYTDAARAYASVANIYSTLARYKIDSQMADNAEKTAKYNAQAARIMANKANTYLAKAAAEDAEKATDNLLRTVKEL